MRVSGVLWPTGWTQIIPLDCVARPDARPRSRCVGTAGSRSSTSAACFRKSPYGAHAPAGRLQLSHLPAQPPHQSLPPAPPAALRAAPPCGWLHIIGPSVDLGPSVDYPFLGVDSNNMRQCIILQLFNACDKMIGSLCRNDMKSTCLACHNDYLCLTVNIDGK